MLILIHQCIKKIFCSPLQTLCPNILAIQQGHPQAKGRVERLWNTLQDRLTVEFNINGIGSIDEANKFLSDFTISFNKRFSVEPKSKISAYRKISGDMNLDYILYTKETRKVDSGSVFSYKGCYFQLVSGGKIAPVIPRSKVTVLSGSRIGIKANYSGKVYNVARLEARSKIAKEVKIESKKQRVYKRKANSHPWKSGYAASVGYDKTDRKTLEGLFISTLAWNENY
ncbi:MAG: hypothetical protein Q8N27_02860 [Candidatus Hydromicrobium sp.]|nr:hypothetical protein [Candidatus Hydromicrobium sp.]